MDNGEITRVLDEIADMLELDGENFFRVRAYRNAARSIGDYPAAIAALDSNQLAQIPGVGADLAAKIRTLVESGELELHRELLAKMSPGLLELRQIRGLVQDASDSLPTLSRSKARTISGVPPMLARSPRSAVSAKRSRSRFARRSLTTSRPRRPGRYGPTRLRWSPLCSHICACVRPPN